MTEIIKGGNLPLSGEPMRVAVVRRDGGPGSPAVDAAALLVEASGQVRGREDLVFYNQPEHAGSGIRLAGKARGEGGVTADWLELDPGRVEPSVERIVVAASCDGGTFGEVEDLYLRAVSAATGAQLALYAVEGATTETAILLGEFYRRDGGWKFRAVGQGYASGLPGLAADFGFTVPDDTPIAPPLPDPLPLPAPALAPAPVAVAKAEGPAPAPVAPPGGVPSGPPDALPAGFGAGFPYVERTGEGPGVVECEAPLPPGFVVVDVVKTGIGYLNISPGTNPNSRKGASIMASSIDDLRGRALFHHDGRTPLQLAVDTRRPWTVTLRPLSVLRRLDGKVEGHGPDVLAHTGEPIDIKVRNLGNESKRGHIEVEVARRGGKLDSVYFGGTGAAAPRKCPGARTSW